MLVLGKTNWMRDRRWSMMEFCRSTYDALNYFVVSWTILIV